MNVQLFFEASDYPILQYWIIDKKTDEIEMALRLVKTQHFHDWYKAHPEGTMDQYLSYRNQQISAYYNSPQYQLESLRGQIEELNNNIEELKEEIQEKKEEIDDLNVSLNQANIRFSIIGIVALCLLIFILRKYIFQLAKIIKGWIRF